MDLESVRMKLGPGSEEWRLIARELKHWQDLATERKIHQDELADVNTRMQANIDRIWVGESDVPQPEKVTVIGAEHIGTGQHCPACVNEGVPDWCDGLISNPAALTPITEEALQSLIPPGEPLTYVQGDEQIDKQSIIRAALRTLASKGFALAKIEARDAHVDYGRPLDQLRTSGLLWLINRTVFHPRGFALGLHENNGEVTGWSLQGDGTDPWLYGHHEQHHLEAAEETLRRQRERR